MAEFIKKEIFKKITSQNFLRYWLQGYGICLNKDGTGHIDVKVKDSEAFVYFENIIIDEPVLLRQISTHYPNIEIKNSKFLSPFSLNATTIKDITIKNSKMTDLSINGRSTIGNLIINENTQLKKIEIKNSQMQNFQIFDSQIDEDIEINVDSEIEKFQLYNISTGNILLNNLNIADFTLKNLNGHGDLVLFKNKISKNLEILDSKINNIYLENVETETDFVITNTKSENISFNINSSILTLLIKKVNLDELEIVNAKIGDIYIDYNSKIRNINNEDSTINNIYVNQKSRIGDISFLEKSSVGDIFISNKSVIGNTNIINSSTGNVNINNECSAKNFKLSNSFLKRVNISKKSKVENFTLTDNSSFENLYLKEDSSLGILKITKCKVNDITIDNSHLESLMLFKGVMGDWCVQNNSVTGNLIFYETECHEVKIMFSEVGSLELNKTIIRRHLKVLDKSKIWKILIQGRDLRRITLKKCYFQEFYWKQDSICVMEIESCDIELFSLTQTSIPKDSVLQVIDTSINEFNCSSCVNTAWINISNLNPLVEYERFAETEGKNIPIIENGKYKLTKIKKNSTLSFTNSDLGKTSFVDCKLDKFDDFVYYNTKMLEVYLGGTQMPTSLRIPNGKEKNEEKEQQRLAYAQIKKIYDNRGDNVTATEFLALELDAYASQLKEKKIKWGERVNLYLNKFSSNYGNDWVRAIIITVLITLFCFGIYCLLLGYGIGTDWEKAFELLSFAPEFLNPLRKADFLKNSNGDYLIKSADEGFSNWARFWDYLSRIIIAYFVYQTIQAFRRFGKK